jgi:hypothetical protein
MGGLGSQGPPGGQDEKAEGPVSPLEEAEPSMGSFIAW